MNRTLFFLRYVRHRTARAFGWKKPGELSQLLEEHGESLTVAPNDVRRRLLEAERCMTCGACVAECSAIREGFAPPPFEPRLLVMATQSMNRELSDDVRAWAPCVQCKACDVACPFGVPVHALVERFRAPAKKPTEVPA